jgi:hypothetical protein
MIQLFTVRVDGVPLIDQHGQLMPCTGMMGADEAVRTILRAGRDAGPATLIELRCESVPEEAKL